LGCIHESIVIQNKVLTQTVEIGDTRDCMIILFLGNPGDRYKNTKHNAGWIVVDQWNLLWSKNKYAECEEAREGTLVFVKPQTFMNESGKTALWYQKEFTLKPEDFVVVYDDVDLPIGAVRVSFNRGSGGHNGIKSIEQAFGSAGFARVRIGVAHADEEGKTILPESRQDFVLSSFSSEDTKTLESLSGKIKKIIETIARDGHREGDE
jgi:PTH1 family peptidyl-tRNA hydrolase